MYIFVYLQINQQSYLKYNIMVTKDLLRRVIYDQRELMEGLGVDRQILKEQIAAPEILVISGGGLPGIVRCLRGGFRDAALILP